MSPAFRRKKTAIAGQFVPHPRQLLESASMRVLSLTERRVLDRIEVEHMTHGGAENGKLPVTYTDFEKWGVRRDSIAGAIRALEALGLIEITRHGYGGAAEKREPNLYRLTYLPAWNAQRSDETGTHEYSKIKTIETAGKIARTVRKAINVRNSDRAKKEYRHPTKRKDFAPQNDGRNAKLPPHKTRGTRLTPGLWGTFYILGGYTTQQAAREARPPKRRSERAACRPRADFSTLGSTPRQPETPPS
jgi:hypothetical protein